MIADILLIRFGIRLVQVFARRQFPELFKMLGTQRFRNGVLAGKPLSQVDQPATVRAERSIFSGEPIAFLPAGRAGDLGRGFILFHPRSS